MHNGSYLFLLFCILLFPKSSFALIKMHLGTKCNLHWFQCNLIPGCFPLTLCGNGKWAGIVNWASCYCQKATIFFFRVIVSCRIGITTSHWKQPNRLITHSEGPELNLIGYETQNFCLKQIMISQTSELHHIFKCLWDISSGTAVQNINVCYLTLANCAAFSASALAFWAAYNMNNVKRKSQLLY